MVKHFDFSVNNFLERPVVVSKVSIRRDFVMSSVLHNVFHHYQKSMFLTDKIISAWNFVAEAIATKSLL